eukprot:GDKJ01010682.1.p3 GENE.GDKJ01010682.1~~GDKJ01010682.1.p3  ORF type:complete len:309 (-),score=11.72 GDKJ01010682.1:2532-3458(-)
MEEIKTTEFNKLLQLGKNLPFIEYCVPLEVLDDGLLGLQIEYDTYSLKDFYDSDQYSYYLHAYTDESHFLKYLHKETQFCSRLLELEKQILNFFEYEKIYDLVINEIDENIIKFTNELQYKRYLEFLSKKNEELVSYLYEKLNIEWILYHRPEVAITKPIAEGHLIQIPVLRDKLSAFIRVLLSIYEVFQKLEEYIEKLHFSGSWNPEEKLSITHHLSANNHKLLLLHRLGIFEPLMEKAKHLTDMQFGILICEIIGADEKSRESMKREAKKLKNEINKSTKKIEIQNTKALNQVNAFLTEIGLINIV